jgi:hypothetical protein
MDTLVISRKASDARDRAYAYNVMSRIPPGQLYKLAENAGLDTRFIDMFYASKGDIAAWPESDRVKFMASIVDWGTMIQIPDTATRMEWNRAKAMNSDMNTTLEKRFGEDIGTLMRGYYDARDKDLYLQNFPQVAQALEFKEQTIASSPLMSVYYNGVSQLQFYMEGQRDAALSKKFGEDITDKVAYYNYLKTYGEGKQAQVFYKANGLKAYYAEYNRWKPIIDKRIAEFGASLPAAKSASLVGDARVESVGQKDVVSALTQTQTPFEQIAQTLPGTISQALGAYYRLGVPLSYTAETQIERIAKDLGMTKYQFMRLAGPYFVQR